MGNCPLSGQRACLWCRAATLRRLAPVQPNPAPFACRLAPACRQDAARDPARRYDPVEAELHGSQLLAADKCPVCKPEALRQAGARPGERGSLIARDWQLVCAGGLSGASLPSDRPHPVCPSPRPETGAAATAAAVPGAGGRGGLNVSAPSFLPHVYTDEHVTAAAAFREFAGAYRERMAEPRGAARRLAGQLEAIPEGG